MRAFKVLLAGDGGVGKTTLLDAFKLGRFFEHNATIGLNITLCAVRLEDGRKCKLIVFDFSGQPRFMRMAYDIPRLVRRAYGAILVFDLSCLMTLPTLLEWSSIIREANGDIPIILVGTKADLEHEVGEEDIRDFMGRLGARAYIETSSKLMKNVDLPFKMLAKMIMDEYTSLSS